MDAPSALTILFLATNPAENSQSRLEAVWKELAEVIKATWAILRIAQTLILSWEIYGVRGIKKR